MSALEHIIRNDEAKRTQVIALQGPGPKGLGEECRALSRQGVERRIKIWGRMDPGISRLAGWADEDPETMRRLLTDPELRAQLLAAIDDLAPEAKVEVEEQVEGVKAG